NRPYDENAVNKRTLCVGSGNKKPRFAPLAVARFAAFYFHFQHTKSACLQRFRHTVGLLRSGIMEIILKSKKDLLNRTPP
ncbi:MAG: hypothetical protein FWF49_06360, partial [Oscillospiraceae bacterium]|nr:hypothetical protein [Oscillospiraceae bacterium]